MGGARKYVGLSSLRHMTGIGKSARYSPVSFLNRALGLVIVGSNPSKLSSSPIDGTRRNIEWLWRWAAVEVTGDAAASFIGTHSIDGGYRHTMIWQSEIITHTHNARWNIWSVMLLTSKVPNIGLYHFSTDSLVTRYSLINPLARSFIHSFINATKYWIMSATVEDTYGALLIGACVACLLSGVVTVQAFLYIKLYPTDATLTKAMVRAHVD